jgi:hypothetical protein
LGRTFTGWIAPACGWRTYSITSSARRKNEDGILIFSAFGLLIDNELKARRLLDGDITGAEMPVHMPRSE